MNPQDQDLDLLGVGSQFDDYPAARAATIDPADCKFNLDYAINHHLADLYHSGRQRKIKSPAKKLSP